MVVANYFDCWDMDKVDGATIGFDKDKTTVVAMDKSSKAGIDHQNSVVAMEASLEQM